MLVAKQVTVTTTPVELLAGEDTSQPYALTLSAVGGVVIGGPGVAVGVDGVDLFFPTFPMIVQGESFWAVSSGSVAIDVLAYSTPGD